MPSLLPFLYLVLKICVAEIVALNGKQLMFHVRKWIPFGVVEINLSMYRMKENYCRYL